MWEIMEFIPIVLTIIFGLSSLYLYLENKKLRGFELEKEIGLKRLEIEELLICYSKRKEELVNDLASRGIASSSNVGKVEEDLKKEFQNKLNKLNAKIAYLDKLRRYKWIFSR